ncbi:TAXI family TRAP transporter solute-binding subunit [Chloroflexota bacterium]
MRKVSMSKVVVVVLLALVLVAMPLAAACAKPAPAPAPKPAPAPAPKPAPAPAPKPAPPKGELPVSLVFVGSGAAKAYTLAAFLSEMVTKYTPMKGSVEKTPGTVHSLEMIATNKAQVYAISDSNITLSTAKLPDIKVRPRTLFSSTGLASATIIGILTKPEAGIKSFKDLQGKKVYAEYLGAPWTQLLMGIWLEVNGMTKEDFTYLYYSASKDGLRDLKEGRVDAMFYMAGSGSVEMAKTTGVYVVPLTPEEQQAGVDLGLGYKADTWPAGASGNPNDTPTLVSTASFWTNPEVSDIAIYTLVKMVFEHLDEFHASQKAATGFTKEAAIADSFAHPYHTGAIAYYKEIGTWTAEHDKKQQKALDKEKKRLGG